MFSRKRVIATCAFLLLFSFCLNLLAADSALAATSGGSQPIQPKTLHGLGRQKIDPNNSLPRPPSDFTVRSNLPTQVDYTAFMPPVGNQGGQGSCVAWATGYDYKTFQEEKKHGWTVNTSDHQYSPAFIYNQINGGQDGGTYPSAAIQLMINKGADTLADAPYNAGDYLTQPTTSQLANAANYKAASVGNNLMYYGGIDAVRQHLADGDIALIGFPVFHEYDSATNSYDYVVTHNQSSTEQPRGYHENTIIGYDDSRQAFRVINQWGGGWANGGYTWMSYAFVRNYALDVYTMVNRAQLNFVNLPNSKLIDSTSTKVAFSTNRATTATIKLNGTVVATDSNSSLTHNMSLTGLVAGDNIFRVLVKDAGGEYTTNTSEISLLIVTEPNDLGNISTSGTLSKALHDAVNGQIISFNLPTSSNNRVIIKGQLPALANGVTLNGGCTASGPSVTLDGSDPAAQTDGLTLSGNDSLYGVRITKFRGRQLVLQGTGNKLSCVVISKR